MRNQFPGKCIDCGATVPAFMGEAFKKPGDRKWNVRHSTCSETPATAVTAADALSGTDSVSRPVPRSVRRGRCTCDPGGSAGCPVHDSTGNLRPEMRNPSPVAAAKQQAKSLPPLRERISEAYVTNPALEALLVLVDRAASYDAAIHELAVAELDARATLPQWREAVQLAEEHANARFMLRVRS